VGEPGGATLVLSTASAAGLAAHDSPGVHAAALAIALTIITILHMTFGEQAPKIFALHKAERLALFVAFPLIWFTAVLRPFIWLVNSISNLLLRVVGVSGYDGHGEVFDIDDLRSILRTASETGRISGRQRVFGENVLGMVRLQARHVMLPRVDVVSLSTAKTQDENLAILAGARHSRFPLGDPDLDSTIGMVHGRDVIAALLEGGPIDFRKLARPLPSVPDRQPLGRLILSLQRQRTTCALVVDERGTSVGLAFLEDALEEIVGPIADEFDQEPSRIEQLGDESFEMAGGMRLPEAADILGIDPGSEEDTIGGHIVSVLGHLPSEGEQTEVPPYRVTVTQMSGRRIARLRFDRKDPGLGLEALLTRPGGPPS
jgi:CBS domain containing-hemolysin-like protein